MTSEIKSCKFVPYMSQFNMNAVRGENRRSRKIKFIVLSSIFENNTLLFRTSKDTGFSSAEKT